MIVPIDRKTAEAYNTLCRHYRDKGTDDGGFMNLMTTFESYSDKPTIVGIFTRDKPDDVKEFDFAVYRIPDDKYWSIHDFTIEQRNETYWFNGCFYNHGTADKPDWSSHT